MVAVPQELALAPLPLNKQAGLAMAGSVLVSGGLGEIGQLAGHWVAAAHASAHVWLLGRSGRSAQSMAAALEQHAGSVSMAAGDVTARADMAGLMQLLAASGAPAVSGVLHAGAVLADALLGRQTAATLRAVFAPKVPGALCLLGATSAMPLQGLLHFSSLTAQLGTPGQSNYAAANGALDGVAQDYLNRGLHSSSVMWGPWASGMALSDAGLLERFQQAGLGAISGAQSQLCTSGCAADLLPRLRHQALLPVQPMLPAAYCSCGSEVPPSLLPASTPHPPCAPPLQALLEWPCSRLFWAAPPTCLR